MRRGDFKAAWRQTDRIELPRREAERGGRYVRRPEHLVWNGEDFEERRVLVYCRHGLGDTIQFARFFPLLRARARHVTVRIQPALLSLFEGMDGVDAWVDDSTDAPDPAHDVAIEVMELAYAFRVSAGTLPRKTPYLPVDRILASAPPFPLEETGKLRVGLVWGSGEWDRGRSIPIEEFAPLAELRRTEFWSLQQGADRNTAANAPFPLTPLSARTEQVRDSAAAMLQLDVMVSVDSMPAHLAGALGCKTLLLLRPSPDWRWMNEGDETLWYPSMRLLRQQKGDGVARVIAGLTRELRRLEEERRA